MTGRLFRDEKHSLPPKKSWPTPHRPLGQPRVMGAGPEAGDSIINDADSWLALGHWACSMHTLPQNTDSASCNLACNKRAQFLQLSSLPGLHFVNQKIFIWKKFCKLKVYSFKSRIRSLFSTGYPPGELYSLLGAPQVNINQTTKVSQFSDLLAAEEGLCPKLQSRYQRHWVLE